MNTRHPPAVRWARAALRVLLVAPLLAAGCDQKKPSSSAAPIVTARSAAPAPRCGPGLGAEDLAGNCRRKDCPTMGALEAEPLDAPCPKAKPPAGRVAPAKR